MGQVKKVASSGAWQEKRRERAYELAQQGWQQMADKGESQQG